MTDKRFIIDEYFEIGSVIIDTENENVKFKHENKLSMKQCCDLLNKLHKENERLKAQLYCDSDEGVCIICKHCYLEKEKTYEKYYISKCKKGHEECSKTDLKYCDDFELKEGDV